MRTLIRGSPSASGSSAYSPRQVAAMICMTPRHRMAQRPGSRRSRPRHRQRQGLVDAERPSSRRSSRRNRVFAPASGRGRAWWRPARPRRAGSEGGSAAASHQPVRRCPRASARGPKSRVHCAPPATRLDIDEVGVEPRMQAGRVWTMTWYAAKLGGALPGAVRACFGRCLDRRAAGCQSRLVTWRGHPRARPAPRSARPSA
jgi:hypothetical protein